MSVVPSKTFSLSIRQRHFTRQRNQTERHLRSGPKTSLHFSDNDYLGLSQHPRVIEAARQATLKYGTGARAARLLTADHPVYRSLESSLAEWKSTEKALLFSAGYLTPLGVIPALVSSQDTIVIERNAHSCLFDGAKLSGAKIRLFERTQPDDLAKVLRLTRKLHPDGKILIVAESMHSMDGDLLPLPEVVQLKEQYGAWLLLDEAHGGGVFGPKGSGWAAEDNLTSKVEIQMGTLGKSLGSSGGFVAASSEIIQHLMNEARTFLFGTALAPAQAAAALAALEVVQSQEGDDLRHRLQSNIQLLRAHRSTSVRGPIQPIHCADNQKALDISQHLLETGIYVPAIRPPTVPDGTARLRVSLSSLHSPEDILRLVRSLNEFLPLS